MKALVECIKGTKEKYESKNGELVLDRMLKKKWNSNYGCIKETLQADGDELDTYILGKVKRGEEVEVLPICIFYCIDGLDIDNKLVCAASTAGKNIKRQVKRIKHFISRYKKGSFVAGMSYKDSNIRYEIAKCKAYYKLFKGGR